MPSNTTTADLSDRARWVLDLRELHDGNTVNLTGPDGLRLTNATASGTALGHSVKAQRRSHRGSKATCIRLTAPDGRSLDLLGWLSTSTTNAHEPTAATLSRTVAYAFKDAPTPEQERAAAERISAVIETGHACLRDSITGAHALALVQCASEGLPVETYRQWAQMFPHSAAAHYDYLRGTGRFSAREVQWLIDADFTPETAREWFGEAPDIHSKAKAMAHAAMREHGWTREQAHDSSGVIAKWSERAAWAPLGPERSDLAYRAGLSPAGAKRLLRRGEWDERTLETLAALRA